MPKLSILVAIKRLNRLVFTSRELAMLTGSSLSSVCQSLNILEEKDLISKVARGIWADINDKYFSPLLVIPFLNPKQRLYVSFISALHIHGIIEQIPQVVTLASTGHTRIINTKVGTFSIHQIAPSLFCGFDWYKKSGDFLIAEPEKALVDSLYLSSKKKKQFGYFPELHFPNTFNFKKAKAWVNLISNLRVRAYVQRNLNNLENRKDCRKKLGSGNL